MKNVMKKLAALNLPKSAYKVWMHLYCSSVDGDDELSTGEHPIVQIQIGTQLTAVSVYKGINALKDHGFLSVEKTGRINNYKLMI